MDMSHDQNNSDPFCPPHNAVIFKMVGVDRLETC